MFTKKNLPKDVAKALQEFVGNKGSGIYVASKTKHALMWRQFRDAGYPIVSTWIDEAGVGETKCFADLWVRCINEASNCQALVLYREPDEVLKGAWTKMGAALTAGRPVHVIGDMTGISCVNHPLVIHYDYAEGWTVTGVLDHVTALGNPMP